MTTPKLVWSHYQNFEGWMAVGHAPYVPPPSPDFNQKCLAVLTATEGGTYDSINAYDSCILSVSLIQNCEAGMFGVSDLLGYLVSSGVLSLSEISPLTSVLAQFGATFGKTPKGSWRFSLPAPFYTVDTKTEQQILFFGAPNVGERGSWTDASKARAAAWATAISSALSDPRTFSAQAEFSALRLRSWYDNAYFAGKSEDGYLGAVHAAYISFAANLPAVARTHLAKFLASEAGSRDVGSRAWAEGALRELTFAGVDIWPHRYDAIRPRLETLFGVDLPDLAQDLKKAGPLTTVQMVQQKLMALNYDIGPTGADGALGPKTKQALLLFQQSMKMAPTGIPDAATCSALWGTPTAGVSA